MAYKPTLDQKKAFIAEIASSAQNAYHSLGKVLPSVCIGMACIESGFGYGSDGSRLMYRHNAVLGQKVGTGRTATRFWSGKFFTSRTGEEYQVGVHSTITAAFRAYDNLEQCIFNYYELLNTSLYKGVTAGVDYATQMAQIKACKYMTSSTEVNSVIKIIREFNLTIFDIGMPQTTYSIGKTYTLLTNLYIRKAPEGEKIPLEEITENAQKNAYTDDKGYAILKKETRVTCKEVRKLNDSTWILIPSGWVCAIEKGKVYIN